MKRIRTGIKDKNGLDIFLGDMVEYKYGTIYRRGVVKFGHHSTDEGNYYSGKAYGFYIYKESENKVENPFDEVVSLNYTDNLKKQFEA